MYVMRTVYHTPGVSGIGKLLGFTITMKNQQELYTTMTSQFSVWCHAVSWRAACVYDEDIPCATCSTFFVHCLHCLIES